MNETLRKELIHRFANDLERPCTKQYREAEHAHSVQLRRLEAAYKGANLNFENELDELDTAASLLAYAWAEDSFLFGYEYCLTMLGLNPEKNLSQQNA